MLPIPRLAIPLLLLAGIVPHAAARSLRDTLAHSTEAIGVSGGPAFDALAESIANTAARNIPILSASAGYTYRYNPDINAFELASDTLGPLLLASSSPTASTRSTTMAGGTIRSFRGSARR